MSTFKSYAELMTAARPMHHEPRAAPWVLHHYTDLRRDVRFFSETTGSLWETNMDVPAQLPMPCFLEVTSVHFGIIWPKGQEAAEDVLRRMGEGQVIVSDFIHFRGSLVNFGPLVMNLKKLRKAMRVWAHSWPGGFVIPPQTFFSVRCTWPQRILDQLKGEEIIVGCALHGTYYRAAP